MTPQKQKMKKKISDNNCRNSNPQDTILSIFFYIPPPPPLSISAYCLFLFLLFAHQLSFSNSLIALGPHRELLNGPSY